MPVEQSVCLHCQYVPASLVPGHTAFRGRIAAESRPKISAREADAVGRYEVAIKTRYSRTLSVVTRGKKFTRGWPREKVLGCSKI